MNNINIMIVGVGGQGSILASKVIGSVALQNSFDIKMSEVHGMSQRGGSVVTSVKLGEKVHAPIIDRGEADIILAFEQLEALRWIEHLQPGGKMVVNTQKIEPVPVIIGDAEYTENVLEMLKENLQDVVVINALEKALQAGSKKVVNVVMLGVMASFLPFDRADWLQAVKENVPRDYLNKNTAAFDSGFNYVSQKGAEINC